MLLQYLRTQELPVTWTTEPVIVGTSRQIKSYKFDTYLHQPLRKHINQNVTHIMF